MSGVRFIVARPDSLGPYVERLRRLERSILYPLADGADHFFIDHGPEYHPFFSSMGDAYFLLVLRGDELLGSVTGVVRQVHRGGRTFQALYICDLKLAEHARGKGLSRRLIFEGLTHLFRIPALRRTRFLYGAAMRGARGDVMRTARGWNPLRMGRPASRLALYFVPPSKLAELDTRGGPVLPVEDGLCLGPAPGRRLEGAGWCTTAGSKDLQRLSTGSPWPLVHLAAPPTAWTHGWAEYLRACGAELAARGGDALACFSIDERLRNHIGWLRDAGVPADSVCTVYSLDLTFPVEPPAWVHLPSSEI
ncbi:GNAT family N-acetyltransferase [Pyxidicoccus fallax]|uniref:GNAT family N-acetyltransferase n=1 Tax=Pyxidicoccus fallax TaxID=394095 RepID=A0A848LTT4_9BACT|nr:GNAT family N-acetyltransferase [Pyxidicoccus fallax]NMO21365.1 GNAT family N-acetyltransferase [Pyxidicoccus fallax]NPC82445.1 GNAT family N-acetyltransferase [Pyxidicoccus fallax]